jgi:hypothetical protein
VPKTSTCELITVFCHIDISNLKNLVVEKFCVNVSLKR